MASPETTRRVQVFEDAEAVARGAAERFVELGQEAIDAIFFGDERCVPPDHSESNYRMANEALISRVSIPRRNVHRINGEGDAVTNARLYEDALRIFSNRTPWPRLDLVLLGMGDDGHTASLFRAQKRWRSGKRGLSQTGLKNSAPSASR